MKAIIPPLADIVHFKYAPKKGLTEV